MHDDAVKHQFEELKDISVEACTVSQCVIGLIKPFFLHLLKVGDAVGNLLVIVAHIGVCLSHVQIYLADIITLPHIFLYVPAEL